MNTWAAYRPVARVGVGGSRGTKVAVEAVEGSTTERATRVEYTSGWGDAAVSESLDGLDGVLRVPKFHCSNLNFQRRCSKFGDKQLRFLSKFTIRFDLAGISAKLRKNCTKSDKY